MLAEAMTTVVGNLTAEPILQYTGRGVARTEFILAMRPRYWSRDAEAWENGDPLYLRCTAWRETAEHIAESLHRGFRVLVAGRLRQRRVRAGDARTMIELEVDEIGPALRFSSVVVTRVTPARNADEATPSGEPEPAPA